MQQDEKVHCKKPENRSNDTEETESHQVAKQQTDHEEKVQLNPLSGTVSVHPERSSLSIAETNYVYSMLDTQNDNNIAIKKKSSPLVVETDDHTNSVEAIQNVRPTCTSLDDSSRRRDTTEIAEIPTDQRLAEKPSVKVTTCSNLLELQTRPTSDEENKGAESEISEKKNAADHLKTKEEPVGSEAFGGAAAGAGIEQYSWVEDECKPSARSTQHRQKMTSSGHTRPSSDAGSMEEQSLLNQSHPGSSHLSNKDEPPGTYHFKLLVRQIRANYHFPGRLNLNVIFYIEYGGY